MSKAGAVSEQTIFKILNAYNAISRSINPTQMLKVDLTSSQVKVLASFAEQETFTMTELSRAHSVSVSTMTSMVDRLLQGNLLERQRDSADRRVVRVSLTREGHKMLKHIMRVRREELEKFLQELDGGEVEQFVTSIETVARYLADAKRKMQNR